MRCRGALFFSRCRRATSFLKRYARLTVPDRSRLTGGSFSRLVILPAQQCRCANDRGLKRRKKRSIARAEEIAIISCTTTPPTNLELVDRRSLQSHTLTGSWCHSVFPFWKGRYPWPRHLPTLRPTGRRDESRSPVSLGCRAEFFFSSVVEGMNPKITL